MASGPGPARKPATLASEATTTTTAAAAGTNTNPSGGHPPTLSEVRRHRQHRPPLSTPLTVMDVDWREHAPPPPPGGTSKHHNHNQAGGAGVVSYVTPVKNQGPHGTCWSFAAAENLEGLQVRQGHPLANISEQEFISCCDECRGASADRTFEWLRNNTGGVPALEESYPYVGNTSVPCSADTAPRARVVLHSWGRVVDHDGTGDAIAAALEVRGPVGLGVDARCFHGYRSGVVRDCGTPPGIGVGVPAAAEINHAVLMVASGTDLYYHHDDYDDDYNNNDYDYDGHKHPDDSEWSLGFPGAVRFYTIKNSWGPSWGEDGYVRIERGKDWWGPIGVIYTE